MHEGVRFLKFSRLDAWMLKSETGWMCSNNPVIILLHRDLYCRRRYSSILLHVGIPSLTSVSSEKRQRILL